MNALQSSVELIARAEAEFVRSEQGDGIPFYRSLSNRHYGQAAVYAALAQAQALTRLAEVAEELLTAGELDRAAALWGVPE